MGRAINKLIEHALFYLNYRPEIVKIPNRVIVNAKDDKEGLNVASIKLLVAFYTEKEGCSIETPTCDSIGITYNLRKEFPVNTFIFNCGDIGILSVYDCPLIARSSNFDGCLRPAVGKITEEFYHETINDALFCCFKVIELPENEQNQVIDVLKQKGIDLYSNEPIYDMINS